LAGGSSRASYLVKTTMNLCVETKMLTSMLRRVRFLVEIGCPAVLKKVDSAHITMGIVAAALIVSAYALDTKTPPTMESHNLFEFTQ
jgi:hypothetical protein